MEYSKKCAKKIIQFAVIKNLNKEFLILSLQFKSLIKFAIIKTALK